MTEPPWRVVVVSTVQPVAEFVVPVLRDLGHEPLAIVSARGSRDGPTPSEQWRLTDATAPRGIDLLYPRDRWSVAPLLRAYDPDLVLCWGYPWKLPPEALAVPKLGAVNQHPALLPRHRGPIPIAWALREGDPEFGITWHRMDAELDTGAILAQATVPVEDDDCTIEEIGPKLGAAALQLLPRVLERVAAGDPGDPQPEGGATWAGYFGEDYAEVDLSRPARRVHDQVRAWATAFGAQPVIGPYVEVDGRRMRLRRTSLRERDDAVARLTCGDGPLWVVAWEPAEE